MPPGAARAKDECRAVSAFGVERFETRALRVLASAPNRAPQSPKQRLTTPSSATGAAGATAAWRAERRRPEAGAVTAAPVRL